MHRLLSSLEEAIAQGRIPREVPFLRAERAVLYARLGELNLARSEVTILRGLSETQTSPVLNAWLWLAEGLADYYENLSLRARDRVHRAMALAGSLKAGRVHALAAAWLAHMNFRVHDYTATVQHLTTALRMAAANHHAARSRACIVAAGAYHYAGREDLAQPWYMQARTHASTEGDGAALSSVMYNMAALRVMEVRLAERFGGADEIKAKRAKLGTESSRFLDQSVRTKALGSHSPMQRALILTAHGEYAEALELYEHYLAEALAEGLTGSECLFQADKAWCLLELGQGDAALVAARLAESAFHYATEPEEQAIAHSLLSMVFGRLGLHEVSLGHAEAAQRMHGVYVSRCNTLLQAMDAAQLESLRLGPASS
jgi:tetratricopeptide (TPR) repeat protein